MDKKEIEFEMEKETKNTIRYAEVVTDDGMPPVVKTIYIQKWALKDKPPSKIKVVITEVK